MGIFGIASTILGQISSVTTPNPHKQQVKQGFQLLQQDLRQAGPQAGAAHGHHHHHQSDGDSGQSSGQPNPISTLFGQLGQDLQSGNLSAAQQAYSSLQQDFEQFALNNSSTKSGAPSGASGANFSVSA